MSATDQYPDDWDERRQRVYKRDGYKCQICGTRGGQGGNTRLHAHHKTPVSEGGSHRLSNLITLCPGCHNDQHDHDILAWINSSNSKSRSSTLSDWKRYQREKKHRTKTTPCGNCEVLVTEPYALKYSNITGELKRCYNCGGDDLLPSKREPTYLFEIDPNQEPGIVAYAVGILIIVASIFLLINYWQIFLSAIVAIVILKLAVS